MKNYLIDLIVYLGTVAYVLFMLHCPIFKPWFGFRKPKDHTGKWFQ